MKFKKIKLKFLNPNNWGIVRAYRDIDNYLDWVKTIKRERANPKSLFNEWKLDNNVFYNVYLTLSLEETEFALPENVKKYKLIESLNPLHRYLDDTLGFAGSLVPEFNQFMDDEGNETLTYLIVYRFAFDKLSLRWLLKWSLLLGISYFIVIRYDLIHLIGSWLTSLT
jgi:DNA primase large subunit